MTERKYCTRCGAPLSESDGFCPNCGAPTEAVPRYTWEQEARFRSTPLLDHIRSFFQLIPLFLAIVFALLFALWAWGMKLQQQKAAEPVTITATPAPAETLPPEETEEPEEKESPEEPEETESPEEPENEEPEETQEAEEPDLPEPSEEPEITDYVLYNRYASDSPCLLHIVNERAQACYLITKDKYGVEVLHILIPAGETIEIPSPKGTYTISCASGETWLNETDLFGPDTATEALDKISLDFGASADIVIAKE